MNLQAVTIGQYYPGDSALHRLDPRTKLTGVMVLSVAIFLPTEWPAYLLTALFVAAALALSRVPVRFLLRGLRPILIFLGITVVLNLFLTPGEPLIQVWRMTITREGLLLSGIATFRLFLLVLSASLLTLTTSPIRLTDGLERMLRPLEPIGVPAHEIALMMTIALRFIPTLIDEADRIIRAQMARGAEFQSGSLLKRMRGLIPVMVPLFVAAFRRADELATAMEARGYRGGKGRTRMKELVFSRRDLFAGSALLAFLVTLVWLRVVTWG